MKEKLMVGNLYFVESSRKGRFFMRIDSIESIDGEWVSGVIEAGTAGALLTENVKEVGDTVTVRRSLTAFRAVRDGKVEVVCVPIAKWGKDHWSTLAYAGTRCVDYGGEINRNHMRVDKDRHPEFAHAGTGEEKYPTILAGGTELHNHDDFDCISDFEVHGLLVTRRSRSAFWCVLTCVLTDKGNGVIAAIQKHKCAGGTFATFRLCNAAMSREKGKEYGETKKCQDQD